MSEEDSGSTVQPIALGGSSSLRDLFVDVGRAHDVPPEILATLSFVETRLRFVTPSGHSESGDTVGMIGLSERDDHRSLELAASLAGLDPDDVRTDLAANLHAGAALLRHYADQVLTREPESLGDWLPVVAEWGGDVYARDVMQRIERGWRGLDSDHEFLIMTARPLSMPQGDGVGKNVYALGYPGATWNAADSSNYTNASRTAADIDSIVIHTTQGSYAGTISWFKNPASDVSAHYVVRSSDGQITQMVDDRDKAWHASCYNSRAIGIEHEGFVADPDTWYTEAMYTKSAALTAWLANKWGVAIDRSHIVGHYQVGCTTHTDPGPGWDWTHYMALVAAGGQPTFDAGYNDQFFPSQMESGEEVVVWFEFKNDSNVTWGLDETRLGTAEPMDRESPFFKDGNWLSPSRATGADHSNYSPGAVGRFTFVAKAPEVTEPTEFTEHFQLVQEGVAWFGPVVSATVRVVPVGWTDPPTDPTDPTDPTVPTDPTNPTDPTGPTDNSDMSGGCSTGSHGGDTGAALLLLGAFLVVRRRRD